MHSLPDIMREWCTQDWMWHISSRPHPLIFSKYGLYSGMIIVHYQVMDMPSYRFLNQSMTKKQSITGLKPNFLTRYWLIARYWLIDVYNLIDLIVYVSKFYLESLKIYHFDHLTHLCSKLALNFTTKCLIYWRWVTIILINQKGRTALYRNPLSIQCIRTSKLSSELQWHQCKTFDSCNQNMWIVYWRTCIVNHSIIVSVH